MKIFEIRSKTKEEISLCLLDLKKEQFNLRFQKATGNLEKTSLIKKVRRDIARFKTVISEKRLLEKKG